MQYYTFTTWQQVKEWISNNGLVRWSFAAERDNDGKLSRYVANSDWYAEPLENKLQQTKLALEQQPGRYLYGSGYRTESKAQGEASCEVMINAGLPGGAINGLQMTQSAQPIGADEREQMRRTIREEVIAEIERKQYEKERKEFEEERKEFQKEKEGAIGLALGYLQPVFAALKQRGKVAGIGMEACDRTAPIQPVDGGDQPEDGSKPDAEQSPFTDEEAEQLMSLMVRFKKAEPDFLKLIEAVVDMAEKGDATYTMAKGVLLK